MNPHNPFGSADFKSAASANFAIPAGRLVPTSVSHAVRVEFHIERQKYRHTSRVNHLMRAYLGRLAGLGAFQQEGKRHQEDHNH